MLPKGQHLRTTMPRFGLPQYMNRFPGEPDNFSLNITGEMKQELSIADLFSDFPLIEQVSDFHCVTTWSVADLKWKGIRFRDFYHDVIVPRTTPHASVKFCQVHCQDGYKSCLPLEDMINDNVLLAGWLNEERLSIAHGAPIRLVLPNHYGYKNAKHVNSISLHAADQRPKSFVMKFLAHPRGRVALEERASGMPGWMLRRINRALIKRTVRDFREALENYEDSNGAKK